MPGAHSQPCPRPTTDSLCRATQGPGTPPKPHPVTRAHRRGRGEATGGREDGMGRQKGGVAEEGGQIHEVTGCDVVLVPSPDNCTV